MLGFLMDFSGSKLNVISIEIKGKYNKKFIDNIIKDLNFILGMREKDGVKIKIILNEEE